MRFRRVDMGRNDRGEAGHGMSDDAPVDTGPEPTFGAVAAHAVGTVIPAGEATPGPAERPGQEGAQGDG